MTAYPAAIALLSPNCIYEIRGVTHSGPEAIVASYKGNGDAAKEFDEITYGSDVNPGEDGWVIITFSDHIRHKGRSLDHYCEQWVMVGDDGMITRIEHHDLPSERERLEAFKRSL